MRHSQTFGVSNTENINQWQMLPSWHKAAWVRVQCRSRSERRECFPVSGRCAWGDSRAKLWIRNKMPYTQPLATTRGHSYKLYIPQSRIDVSKYFFSRRVIHCWNTLPACDEDFSCLSSFKRLLYRSDLIRFTLRSVWSTVSLLFLFCFFLQFAVWYITQWIS